MDYRIDKIKIGDTEYTVNTSGLFTNRNVVLSKDGLITTDDVRISKVTRLSDGVTFELEEDLAIDVRYHEKIEEIYINVHTCQLITEESTVISMIEAIKYVEPVKVKKTRKSRGICPFTEVKNTIEQQFHPSSGIRLEATLLKTVRKLTLKQFLTKFFTEWNSERNTIFVESREIQTAMNKRRSLGDIYMICKYYYPEITLKELIQLLYVDLASELSGFRTSICSQINKRVWYYDPSKSTGIYDETDEDEFGNDVEFYTDNLD